MHTYNITFIVDSSREEELLKYLREKLIPLLFKGDSPAMNPKIKKVVEAGGERPGEEHGLSIALSAQFPSEETAHFWNDHLLLPALGDFNLYFGNNSLFFVTLLENIDI